MSAAQPTVITDSHLREYVDIKAQQVRGLIKKAGENVVDIGRILHEVNHKLAHGQWEDWLEKNFRWSDRQARNFIKVFEWANETRNRKTFSDLPIEMSALYLLARPSTPAAVREQAIQLAETGEPVTHKTAKAMIAAAPPKPSLHPVFAAKPTRRTREQIRAQEEREERNHQTGGLSMGLECLAEITISAEELIGDLMGKDHYMTPEVVKHLPVALALLIQLRDGLRARGYYQEAKVGKPQPLAIKKGAKR